ncbi:hypothetical protein GCM10010872_14640 [Dyella flava]|nr:hypothetical protein GCM10010872_14640 [Dyella flava]
MQATMAVTISLSIAVNIDTPRHHPPGHRALPDSGTNDFSPPLHVCWKTDIDRNDVAHGSGLREHQRKADQHMLRTSRLIGGIEA